MSAACRLYTEPLPFTTLGQRLTSFATATKQPRAVLISVTSSYSKCLQFQFFRCHGHADVPAPESEHLTDGNHKERPPFSESFSTSGQQTTVAVTSRISPTILSYQVRYNTDGTLIQPLSCLSSPNTNYAYELSYAGL